MRQFKFRIWDSSMDLWVGSEQWFIDYRGVHFKDEKFSKNPDLIISQATGLVDKNGNEIYEGDIIDNEGAKQKYEVIFHKGCFCISQGGLGYHIFNEKKVEVIANIYENSEFLANI